MTLTDIDLIEYNGIGVRADLFTLRVVGTDRTPLGEDIAVSLTSPPSLQLNTSNTNAMRTLSNVTIIDPPADLNLPFTRIMPILTLSNGSQYPLGVFMFGTDNRTIFTDSEIWTPEMFDEGFLLNQDLDRTWSLPAGGSVLTMFTQMAGEILGPLGIPTNYNVTDVASASPLTYKVGTSRIGGLQAMAALLGAFPPFFNNPGAHTLKAAPPAGATADHIYTSGTRILDGTFKTSDSSYKAFNRYIVVGDDVSGAAVRGVYDIPDSAPHSYANTGQIHTSTHTVSGVTDPALAQEIAYVDAITDHSTYSTATFSAKADPRHDAFDTVNGLGNLYLETGWSMDLISGGANGHSLSRIWQ